MASRFNGLTSWLGGNAPLRVPELGPRELDVLGRLWESGDLTAAGLAEQLGAERITLSTVQSTLERLHRKGIVSRDKQGRAFRYRAALSQSQLIGLLLRDLAEDFGGGDPAPLISGFVDFAAGEDPAIRRELARLLAKTDDRESADD